MLTVEYVLPGISIGKKRNISFEPSNSLDAFVPKLGLCRQLSGSIFTNMQRHCLSLNLCFKIEDL